MTASLSMFCLLCSYLIKPSSLSPQLSRLMNETTLKRRRRKRDKVKPPLAKADTEVSEVSWVFYLGAKHKKSTLDRILQEISADFHVIKFQNLLCVCASL